MAYKRKRVGSYKRKAYKRRKITPYKKKRMSYRARSRRMVMAAMEVKRRYFNQSAVDVTNASRLLYQPFNYFSQGTTDATINGNSVYIRTFHLKGKIAANPDAVVYAAPMYVHIYLVRARDEVNTGSISEGMTQDSATVNAWFNGASAPSQWYIDSSRVKILYHKKIRYVPNQEQGFNTVGIERSRAPNSIEFYCKKTVNVSHGFKEFDDGTVAPGYWGKYSNYYWVVVGEQALGYADAYLRLSYTSLVTYKDM